MKNSIIILSIALILIACGQNAWNKALEENSIEGYKNFIEKNSKSEFVETAKFKLDSLIAIKDSVEWKSSENINTKNAFEEYLVKNPGGKHIESAKEKIKYFEEDEVWQNTEAKLSLDEIRKFVEKNPKNRNTAMAISILKDFNKNRFSEKYPDIAEFAYKLSKKPSFSTIKDYTINNKFVYLDSIACFGVSGENCDQCTRYIVSDSAAFAKVNAQFATITLVDNIKTGGLKRVHYDYYGTKINEEFVKYEISNIANGLKIKVYNLEGHHTFTFIRRVNKLILSEIFSYLEMADL